MKLERKQIIVCEGHLNKKLTMTSLCFINSFYFTGISHTGGQKGPEFDRVGQEVACFPWKNKFVSYAVAYIIVFKFT